jgi:hypothetical protein
MGPQVGRLSSSPNTNWLVNNAATDTVRRAATKLATLEAQTLGGQVTNLKEKLAQNSKISLTDNPESALDALDRIIESADDVLLKVQARDNVIEKNGGNQPKNIKKYINEEYQKLKIQKNTETFNTVNDLPDPKIENGEIFEDDNGGGFISDGTKWIPLTTEQLQSQKRGF